jgi:hypothetical protein
MMVALPDITYVSDLSSEWGVIGRALEVLAAQGRIVQMTLVAEEQMPVTVDTREIAYPPAMIAGIQAALTQRRAAIVAELQGFGVTDIVEAQRQ